MRSTASTWQKSMGPRSYSYLLRSLVARKNYECHYSHPQLVNGGLSPPPSKFYPGTTCYMVILTVDGKEHYGFGPTPSLAKHFASFEAYNSLHPLPSEEVERFRSTIPVEVVESADEALDTPECSDTELHDTEGPLSCHSDSDLHTSTCLETVNDASANGSNEPSSVADTATQESVIKDTHNPPSPQQPCVTASGREEEDSLVEVKESSQSCSREGTTNRKYATMQDYCAIPTPQLRESLSPGSFDFPSTPAEFQSRNRGVPLSDKRHPNVWIHDETVSNQKRDVCVDLDEMARRKGVRVSFKFKQCDPLRSRAVMVIAKAAGYQFIGRHFEKPYFAKCEAAIKMLSALAKLPDVGSLTLHSPLRSSHPAHPTPSSRPSSSACQPPLPLQPSTPPVQSSVQQPSYQASQRDRQHFTTLKDPAPPQLTKTPPQRSLRGCENESPTSRELSISPISHNPIGQLQELMLKEHLDLPVYSESVHSVGMYTEYICTVSAKGLSAKGIGSSKKLAKRHAAENLLGVMQTLHMSIDPTTVRVDSKKPREKSLKRARTLSVPSPHHPSYRAHPPPPPRAPLLPSLFLSHDQPFQPPHMDHQRPYLQGPYNTLRPPHTPLIAHPYGPPPHVVGRPSPPSTYPSHVPGRPSPPRTHSLHSLEYHKAAYVSEPETDSETECTEASPGLCEMVPLGSHGRMYQRREARSNEQAMTIDPVHTHSSKESFPQREDNLVDSTQLSPQPVDEERHQSTSHVKTFTDVESPFNAHSDPFQFTTRLPKERKEPWTGNANLNDPADTDTVVATKPPWSKIRREASNGSVQTQRSVPTNRPPNNQLPPCTPPVHPLFTAMERLADYKTQCASVDTDIALASAPMLESHDSANVSHDPPSVSPDPAYVTHSPIREEHETTVEDTDTQAVVEAVTTELCQDLSPNVECTGDAVRSFREETETSPPVCGASHTSSPTCDIEGCGDESRECLAPTGAELEVEEGLVDVAESVDTTEPISGGVAEVVDRNTVSPSVRAEGPSPDRERGGMVTDQGEGCVSADQDETESDSLNKDQVFQRSASPLQDQGTVTVDQNDGDLSADQEGGVSVDQVEGGVSSDLKGGVVSTVAEECGCDQEEGAATVQENDGASDQEGAIVFTVQEELPVGVSTVQEELPVGVSTNQEEGGETAVEEPLAMEDPLLQQVAQPSEGEMTATDWDVDTTSLMEVTRSRSTPQRVERRKFSGQFSFMSAQKFLDELLNDDDSRVCMPSEGTLGPAPK